MLEVNHISFSYGKRRILDDVSFDAASGEIVAVVGANGVGKTTLLRVLAGLRIPAGGRVVADGFDILDEPLRYRRFLGYLPETCPLYDDMTVKAYLVYRARLKGERSMRVRYRVSESLALCGLDAVAKTPIRFLSQGYRKRVGLADAILLRPRFLLLDDLLAGLDPATRGAVGKILPDVAVRSAIVVTGHELDELARWATRFVVLADGRLAGVFSVKGTPPDALRARLVAAIAAGGEAST